nr:hypothetical protein [Tanacetum cinerariifolium]
DKKVKHDTSVLDGIPNASTTVQQEGEMKLQPPHETPINKMEDFVEKVDFVILDIIEDDNVPIILERPLLAATHARIDVFGGKISLEVGKEQIIFNVNEGATPYNCFAYYEALGAIPFSPNKSPGSNWDPVGYFQDSNDDLGIGIDDFVAIDDL